MMVRTHMAYGIVNPQVFGQYGIHVLAQTMVRLILVLLHIILHASILALTE